MSTFLDTILVRTWLTKAAYRKHFLSSKQPAGFSAVCVDVHQTCQSNQIPLVECDNLIGPIIWKASLQATRGSFFAFFVGEPLIQGTIE